MTIELYIRMLSERGYDPWFHNGRCYATKGHVEIDLEITTADVEKMTRAAVETLLNQKLPQQKENQDGK